MLPGMDMDIDVVGENRTERRRLSMEVRDVNGRMMQW
jgi:hypothetical protein